MKHWIKSNLLGILPIAKWNLLALLLIFMGAVALEAAQIGTGMTDRFDGGAPSLVRGRVLREGGISQSPASVQLVCAGQLQGSTVTDAEGYFVVSPNRRREMPGAEESSARTDWGIGRDMSMRMCEVRIVSRTYHPLAIALTDSFGVGGVDLGTVVMEPVEKPAGDSVSVSTLHIPADAEKEYVKGSEFLAKSDTADARMHLEKAVGMYGDFGAAWQALGQTDEEDGKLPEAEQAYRNAISADAGLLDAQLGLASALAKQARWDAAAQAAEDALKLDANSARALLIQALAYLNLDRLEEAAKSAEHAEKLAAESMPRIEFVLGEIYLHSGQQEKAISHLLAYLERERTGPLADMAREIMDKIPDVGNNSPDASASR